jgi:hypothetical protein
MQCNLCEIDKPQAAFNRRGKMLLQPCKICHYFLSELRRKYTGTTDVRVLAREASRQQWKNMQAGMCGWEKPNEP